MRKFINVQLFKCIKGIVTGWAGLMSGPFYSEILSKERLSRNG